MDLCYPVVGWMILVYRYVKECGLKDEELLLSNNDSLDDIFKSDQWENFFQTLLNDPKMHHTCVRRNVV